MTLLTQHLTSPNPELDRLAEQTPPGMAHWSGTGPNGATCGSCRHYGFERTIQGENRDEVFVRKHRTSCAIFWRLMGRVGPGLPHDQPACRYWGSLSGSEPLQSTTTETT